MGRDARAKRSVWTRAASLVALVVLLWGGGHAGPADQPVAGVRGVVVGPGGEPVAGAQVRAIALRPYQPTDPFSPAFRAVTDADGRFAADLAPGRYHAAVTKGQLTAGVSARLLSWRLEAGETLELEIPLERGGRVAGTVVRKADGAPVAGAGVVTTSGLTAWSDERGRFALEGLSRDCGTVVRVTAEGLGTGIGGIRGHGTGTYPLRFELSPGYAVRGRVVDEQGAGIPDALVCARPWAPRGYRSDYETELGVATDDEGRYELRGFPRARPIPWVFAAHPRFATASKRDLSPPKAGEAKTVDFVLGEGYAVRGCVAGPGGKRIEGAIVRTGYGLRSRRTRSDEHGRFRLDRLRKRKQTLYVSVPGYADAVSQVTPGRRSRWSWLPLVRGVPHLTFRFGEREVARGRVVDRQGRPIAGARVVAWVRHPWKGSSYYDACYTRGVALSDEQGRFELSGLPPCRSRVIVYADGYCRAGRPTPLNPDGESVLVLDREGVVTGRVVEAKTGRPVTAFRLKFARDLDGIQWRSEDGVFEWRNRVAGSRHRVFIAAEGHPLVETPELLAQPVTGPLTPTLIPIGR